MSDEETFRAQVGTGYYDGRPVVLLIVHDGPDVRITPLSLAAAMEEGMRFAEEHPEEQLGVDLITAVSRLRSLAAGGVAQ